MASRPTLIYCAAGNPRLAQIAVDAGWKYGARLPASITRPIYFADQNWKEPNREEYLEAIQRHRPTVATVLDWERPEQENEVMAWADGVARFVSQVVLIPKWPGCPERCPRRIGTAEVVLGYSVPTSYGGTPVPLWEFRGWPVHLLGGTPHRQMEIARYVQVVSVDGSIAVQQARGGRCWLRRKGKTSHWWQLRDIGDTEKTDALYRAFQRSCEEVRLAWEARPQFFKQQEEAMRDG